MKLIKFGVVPFFLAVILFGSCEKVDKIEGFNVKEGENSGVFRSLDVISMPDGLWKKDGCKYFHLNNDGEIIDNVLVDAVLPWQVTVYFLWKDNAVSKAYYRYNIYTKPELPEYVIPKEASGTLSVGKMSRKGECAALCCNAFMVTEFNAGYFSYIYELNNCWAQDIYEKVTDKKELDFVFDCPYNREDELHEILKTLH